jgi:hypothetical protein
MTASGRRRRRWPVKWILVGAVVAGLLAASRLAAGGRVDEAARGWISGLGALGYAAFYAIYVVAALLFVPGAALTIGAGFLFGLVRGTAIVSAASTTAAGLAFLIARHVARGAVEARARKDARFTAIDRAIGERGWKIVALLRLSPAVPFQPQQLFLRADRDPLRTLPADELARDAPRHRAVRLSRGGGEGRGAGRRTFRGRERLPGGRPRRHRRGHGLPHAAGAEGPARRGRGASRLSERDSSNRSIVGSPIPGLTVTFTVAVASVRLRRRMVALIW